MPHRQPKSDRRSPDRRQPKSPPSWLTPVVCLPLLMLLTFSIGVAGITEAGDAARALRDGQVGTFTATHREASGSKGRQHWVGTFVSNDRTVELHRVSLRLNGSAPPSDPPPVYRDARHGTGDDPLVYPADFDVRRQLIMGLMVLVGGFVIGIAGLLATFLRHRGRRSRSARTDALGGVG